jgi:protein phosphatase 2C
MEEISAAMAVPFVLGNLIYEESVLTTHVEIAGFELITSKTSLLTEPPSTKVSIGTGNESYDCHNLDTGAPIVKVSSVKEIKKVIEDTKKVMEDGNVSVSSDTADLEGKSITDSEIPIDVVTISGNIATVDGSIFLETNTMLKNVGDLEKVVVNNESKDIESVKNMTNTVSKNVEDKEKAVVNNERKDVDSNKTVATAHSEAPREKKIKICSENVFELGCVPLWGYQSICGKSKDMEDAVVALPRFLRIPSQMIMCGQSSNGMNQNPSHVTADFFGVYDGHGGFQVANYCRDRIHLALSEEIEIVKEDFLKGSIGNNWQQMWEKALLNCFVKVNAEVGGVRVGNHGNADASEGYLEPVATGAVGSTAVVAIVCPTHLIVANCGDSRAVLCRGKAAMPLSVDHKPDREDERARIEALGGKVFYWQGFRVSGVLAMSRSIGDNYLEPYVIPDPEMMFVQRTKEDECLILASDGLWDVMTNEEACDFARKRILIWHKRNMGSNPPEGRGEGIDPAAQDAADYLSRLALHRGSGDNISVIVVDLKAQRKVKKRT